MTIFDDLGKTLNDVAAATADMLGDLAEAAKVKTTIAVSYTHLDVYKRQAGYVLADAPRI